MPVYWDMRVKTVSTTSMIVKEILVRMGRVGIKSTATTVHVTQDIQVSAHLKTVGAYQNMAIYCLLSSKIDDAMRMLCC